MCGYERHPAPENIRSGLATWLEDHNYDSVDQLRGSLALGGPTKPITFERANYLRVLSSYTPADPWRFGASALQPPDQ